MKGDKVEVVVVEEGSHVCVAGFIAVDKLVGKVFDHYSVLEESVHNRETVITYPLW